MSTVSVKSTDFVFSGTQASGTTVDGCGYVVAGGGTLTLTSVTPAKTQDGNGNDYNGFMLNPEEALNSFPDQAWDERMAVIGSARYDASLQPSLPLTVSAGDIIVHMVGADFSPDLSSGDSRVRAGIMAECNVIYVVASAPGAEEFPPSCWGWSGRSSTAFYSLTDTLDNIVAALPAYSLSGVDAPTASEVLTMFDHFDPFYGYSHGANWKNFGSYENGSIAKGYSNYGREFAQLVGAAGLMLISDGLTDAQKRTMLVRMISQGIQWGEATIATDSLLGGNGGHHQFHHIPVALALKYTDVGNLSDLDTIMPGNCLGQTFTITQSNIDNDFVPHNDPSNKPWPWALCTIQSVSGNDITTSIVGSTFQTLGLVLTRQSDGATATIVAGKNQTQGFTIDAQPSPAFQVGQTVYYDAPWLSAGDADWNIQAQNRVDYIPEFNPSANASYRSLNHYLEEAMVMKATGCWITAFDKMADLVVNSKTANFPTAANEWPEHGAPGTGGLYAGHAFGNTFWDAHWTAIDGGVPPEPPSTPAKAVLSGGVPVLMGGKLVIG